MLLIQKLDVGRSYSQSMWLSTVSGILVAASRTWRATSSKKLCQKLLKWNFCKIIIESEKQVVFIGIELENDCSTWIDLQLTVSFRWQLFPRLTALNLRRRMMNGSNYGQKFSFRFVMSGSASKNAALPRHFVARKFHRKFIEWTARVVHLYVTRL